jgi:hypothetical protein
MYGVALLFKKFQNQHIKKIVFYYLLTFALVSCFLYSPLPGMMSADYRMFRNSNNQTIQMYLSIIPPSASVAASNDIGAHLSHREKIYVVPFGMGISDYIVLHGANAHLMGMVDMNSYDTLVSNKKINFYIFKKHTKACHTCRP